ncbi:hypothetical protein L226DRAFT_552408 [Lentinus tigrinus ALCF2SS1-7]|uniref:F-box domain-containing protein n=1 Tax=Lentinus tigrinus ALCF2SS1-6 TaxID=1328759 RepID=A0A5C2SDN9_9APHY|nr:hypothetical protein L227DRAFT_600218 [Lentinus tigrinus ALCF2SS1-6]RPD75932.1 hypothetical protein L226DRAFT_552408 [Lentinus tigrinus ALCF2SS1-7]
MLQRYAQFEDLPLELLPVIIQHVVKPSHLAAICLVDHRFYQFTVPLLYERVFIYAWHREGKAKVIKLFRTLAEYPHLAKYVLQLVIRDFPKALQSEDHDQILDACLAGLRNCINLRSCTWTRHGSLTSSVLETLVQCKSLWELEINGENASFYDPAILPQFCHLQKLTLIMPSASVVANLLPWAKNTGSTLRHLSIICKSSTRVNDGVLQELAPYLTNLDYLYLVGCPKVTHDGLWALLSGNYRGIVGLGMEGLSTAFDMSVFSQRCNRGSTLSRLRSITITVDEHTSLEEWQQHVLDLLSNAPLQRFHISTVGGHVDHRLSDDFCKAVVSAHGSRLTRFSVHRMRMSINAIGDICRRCTVLQQLFVVVEQGDLDALGPCLAQAPMLRAVHVNRPLDFGSEDVPRQSYHQILSIARQCRPSVKEFGFNTRVFQVERVPITTANGTVDTEVILTSYENPEIPEQFLVVRT